MLKLVCAINSNTKVCREILAEILLYSDVTTVANETTSALPVQGQSVCNDECSDKELDDDTIAAGDQHRLEIKGIGGCRPGQARALPGLVQASIMCN